MKRGRISSSNSHSCRREFHDAAEWGRRPAWIPGEKGEVLPDIQHYDLEDKRNEITPKKSVVTLLIGRVKSLLKF